MTTEQRRQIAIENGKKSRGPKTAAGKAISSRNAVKHGFVARNILIHGESPERFAELVDAMHREFAPETPSENAAVESMIFSRWRQMRIWTMEKAYVDTEIRTLGKAPADLEPQIAVCTRASLAFRNLAENSNTLSLFHRYETSYDRQFTRALRRFLAIREARRRAEKLDLQNEPTELPFFAEQTTEDEPRTNHGRTGNEPITNPVQTDNQPETNQP
jgi:hypothetical protein